MAVRKKPKTSIARKRRRVKRKKRVTSHTKRKKKKPKRKRKKKSKRKKLPPRPQKLRPARSITVDELELERLVAQVIQRTQEKIIKPGYVETEESMILAGLIAAEQIGNLDEAYYDLADEYEWTPQEVYELWAYADQ